MGHEPTTEQKTTLLARLATDSFIEKGTFFCSAGVKHEEEANLSLKLLMFGFGFFILIVCSAYVADLAAFITQNAYVDIRTAEAAIANGKTICVLTTLKTELEAAYPTGRFVFGGNSYFDLIGEYRNNKCDFLAIDTTSSIELVDQLCELDLVLTNSVMLETSVGLPIRSDLNAGLNFWIYSAGVNHGVTVQSILEEQRLAGKYRDQNTKEPKCEILLSKSESSEVVAHERISPKNLLAPVLFFLAFAALASIVHCLNQRKSFTGFASAKNRTDSALQENYDAQPPQENEEEDETDTCFPGAKVKGGSTSYQLDVLDKSNHINVSDGAALLADNDGNDDVDSECVIDEVIAYMKEMKIRRQKKIQFNFEMHDV